MSSSPFVSRKYNLYFDVPTSSTLNINVSDTIFLKTLHLEFDKPKQHSLEIKVFFDHNSTDTMILLPLLFLLIFNVILIYSSKDDSVSGKWI